jgi:hypothetical protein
MPKLSTVRFRNQDLLCLEEGDEIWVAMRPVVEGMGLDWKTQYRKLTAASERFCVVIMTTQVPGDDQSRDHIFIPLGRLFGWLMTIYPSKVAPEIRPEVIAYQQECDRVLAHHFMHEIQGLRTELLEVRRWHWKRERALHQGWYDRYPHWERIRRDYLGDVPRAVTAAALGCTPSTITRNRRRILDAGLLH